MSNIIPENGQVYSWGYNGYGELGIGNTASHQIDIQAIPSLNNIVAIAAGQHHSLALTGLLHFHLFYLHFSTTGNGIVYSWGYNQYGQLGIGNNKYSKSTPQQVPDINDVIAIAAGFYHSIALQSMLFSNDLNPIINITLKTDNNGGTIYTWGHNQHRELGIGNTTDQNRVQRVLSPFNQNIIKITAGSSHNIVLSSN